MNDAPRVLCVRRGGLGDTLLMVPVLRALRRAWPGRELVFVGVAEHAEVLAHCGVADRARSSEDLAACVLRGAEPPPWAAGAALVVADDPAFAALARPRDERRGHGGAAEALAPELPAASTEVRCYDPRAREAVPRPLPLQLAAQLGLELRWPQDGWLAGPRSDGADADQRVMLAPGSGGTAKCWPRARWLALAVALAARGEQVDVLVGPVESERDDPRRWPWPAAVGFVAGLALPAVVQRMRSARSFVGNDSGTTHLAAMLGVPTVAVFGPGEPEVFAPNGPFVELVRAPSRALADVGIAEVTAALARVRAAAAARGTSRA